VAQSTNKRTVLVSFEDGFQSLCVDVFRREDGTFGYEEFRGEADGASRWQSLHRYGHLSFATGDEALANATAAVHWLKDVGPWRW